MNGHQGKDETIGFHDKHTHVAQAHKNYLWQRKKRDDRKEEKREEIEPTSDVGQGPEENGKLDGIKEISDEEVVAHARQEVGHLKRVKGQEMKKY